MRQPWKRNSCFGGWPDQMTIPLAMVQESTKICRWGCYWSGHPLSRITTQSLANCVDSSFLSLMRDAMIKEQMTATLLGVLEHVMVVLQFMKYMNFLRYAVS